MENKCCAWACVGDRVIIKREDISKLDARNKKKEGIIIKIDGDYIYVRALYQKHLRELYINEIFPIEENVHKMEEHEARFQRVLKAMREYGK